MHATGEEALREGKWGGGDRRGGRADGEGDERSGEKEGLGEGG